MTRTSGKLGKAPAQPRPKDITFAEVAAAGVELPAAPVGFGHYDVFPKDGWDMLGNDEFGDCVWAGADHETAMINKMNGRTVAFTRENALADYGSTGFDPSDPSTDRGTDMHQAMDYRRKTGVIDSDGHRHKIGAYVSLEPGNYGQTLEALRAFDFVAIGFLVPAYAMAQFAAGKPWTFQTRNAGIEGGHYVPVVGRPHSWTLEVVTWGQTQAMGRKFFEAYCDEAYGIVTVETLNKQGVTPEGLNITRLNEILGQI